MPAATVPRRGRFGVAALLCAGIGLIALVLTARLPGTPKILAVLNDAAHAPVFGALALIVLGLIPDSVRGASRTTIAFVVTVLAGIGVEWFQGVIGRDASWSDVWTDTLGAACALSAAAWWQARNTGNRPPLASRRSGLAVAIVAGGLIMLPIGEAALAYARRAALFPVVAEYSSPLDRYFMEAQGVRVETRPLPAPWGRSGDPLSLLLHVTGGEFPGITHMEPQPDWSGYRLLQIDVTNPADEPLLLTLRVHDAAHDQQYADRFNRTFEIPARSRELQSIALEEIEQGPEARTLDLGKVAGLIVFTSGTSARHGREFYVTRIWLE